MNALLRYRQGVWIPYSHNKNPKPDKYLRNFHQLGFESFRYQVLDALY